MCGRSLSLAQVDIHGKLVAEYVFFNREGMPRAIDNDRLFRTDDAAFLATFPGLQTPLRLQVPLPFPHF